MKNYLISKDNGKLQMPYAEYVALMEKVKKGRELRATSARVAELLSSFLGENAAMPKVAEKIESAMKAAPSKTAVDSSEKPPATEKQAAEQAETAKRSAKTRETEKKIEIPPIKKDIADHFNKLDESGRMFSVFKQYYSCLNDTCGGTVRVTMKDGFCSLWNYDEWEEFAFVDIFEGQLRIAVDPRYAGDLHSFEMCEVPRLLSGRRNLVCVRVGDLNNTMLGVLAKAFEEVGMTTS